VGGCAASILRAAVAFLQQAREPEPAGQDTSAKSAGQVPSSDGSGGGREWADPERREAVAGLVL